MAGRVDGVSIAGANLIEGSLMTSDGATMRYRACGAGEPLVLLHGWSQSGALFRHQMEGLSGSFRLIVPDFRGHGESPTPKGGLRIARLAKDLHELLRHLGLERAHLLGWSMGASVIWSYIDTFGTGQIDKLIFVDQPSMLTVWPWMSQTQIEECGALFNMQAIESLCTRLQSAEGEELRANFVRSMVTTSMTPEVLDWVLAENAKTSLPVASQLLWSHCTQDWRDVLGRIDRPTLVICGEKSHVNPKSQYYIQRQIQQAAIREFSATEGGAHFMFLEAPEIFNGVVASFLKGEPTNVAGTRGRQTDTSQ